jgi:hypothetical protein
MDYFHVFVLTQLSLDKTGDIKSRNVAVTFDLFEAEDHRNKAQSTATTHLSFPVTGARMPSSPS